MTSCTSGPVPSSITFEAGYLPELEGSTEAVLSFPPILYAGSRQVIAFTGLAAATSGNANYFALVCAAGACCAGSCTLTCCNAVNQISLTTVRTIGLPTNVERGVIYRTAGLTEGFYRACLLANAPAPFAGTFSTFAAAVQVYSSNQPPPLPPPVPPVGPYPSLPPPSPFSPSPPSPPPMPPPVESVWMYPGPRPFSDGLGSCLDFGGGASSASGTATSSATPPKPPMSPLPAPPMAPPPCTLNYIQSCTPPSPPASVVECLTIGTLVGFGIGGGVVLCCLCCCIMAVRRCERTGSGPTVLIMQFGAISLVRNNISTPDDFSTSSKIQNALKQYGSTCITMTCALIFVGVGVVVIFIVQPLSPAPLEALGSPMTTTSTTFALLSAQIFNTANCSSAPLDPFGSGNTTSPNATALVGNGGIRPISMQTSMAGPCSTNLLGSADATFRCYATGILQVVEYAFRSGCTGPVLSTTIVQNNVCGPLVPRGQTYIRVSYTGACA